MEHPVRLESTPDGFVFEGVRNAQDRTDWDFGKTGSVVTAGELRSMMKPQTKNSVEEMDLIGLSTRPAELSDEEIVNIYLQSRNEQDFERLVHRYER